MTKPKVLAYAVFLIMLIFSVSLSLESGQWEATLSFIAGFLVGGLIEGVK